MDRSAAFRGRDILVTGAGGYIGSALVKSLAAAVPRSLILLESSEHNLFELRRALADFPFLSSRPVLGSVEDTVLLNDLFTSLRPQIIFHAAAFKHVELLETNPFAAVSNNVLGTYSLAQTALRYGSQSLVLVSTDKAVRPRSVMGVSKRIAELITVALSRPTCRMNAVRLGNVVNSTGSVIPIFVDQLTQGKPLTVTHRDASRYFLSLEETVSAILEAGSCSCEGCVLLPHFDPPVRIADLARSLAVNRGDIQLEFIGLRPGEKLTEDLISPNETQAPSFDGPLTVLHPPRLSAEACEQAMNRLSRCIASRNSAALLEILTALVPEYEPSELMLESATLVTGV